MSEVNLNKLTKIKKCKNYNNVFVRFEIPEGVLRGRK